MLPTNNKKLQVNVLPLLQTTWKNWIWYLKVLWNCKNKDLDVKLVLNNDSCIDFIYMFFGEKMVNDFWRQPFKSINWYLTSLIRAKPSGNGLAHSSPIIASFMWHSTRLKPLAYFPIKIFPNIYFFIYSLFWWPLSTKAFYHGYSVL